MCSSNLQRDLRFAVKYTSNNKIKLSYRKKKKMFSIIISFNCFFFFFLQEFLLSFHSEFIQTVVSEVYNRSHIFSRLFFHVVVLTNNFQNNKNVFLHAITTKYVTINLIYVLYNTWNCFFVFKYHHDLNVTTRNCCYV